MCLHCKEPWCSFQTLEDRSPIGYYAGLFDVHVVTYTFSWYDQSRHPSIRLGAVGKTMDHVYLHKLQTDHGLDKDLATFWSCCLYPVYTEQKII